MRFEFLFEERGEIAYVTLYDVIHSGTSLRNLDESENNGATGPVGDFRVQGI